MKPALIAIFLAMTLWTVGADAKIVTRNVAYQHDGLELEGYLAYDDAAGGTRPGVLVVHEWWGLNDYARNRAEQLAGMGYVAFALDMYGKGKVTEHPSEAAEWVKQVNANVDLWRRRAAAGLQVLLREPGVDGTRIAAIGYCFGGSTVQQLAYGGADIRGIVSFHGSLLPPGEEQARRVKAKILICHGAADPMSTRETLQDYLAAMEKTTLDWRMIVYGNAKHGFTNPGADRAGMEGVGYDKLADNRSWQDMKVFFDEIFASR